jgi:hypothetical protein
MGADRVAGIEPLNVCTVSTKPAAWVVRVQLSTANGQTISSYAVDGRRQRIQEATMEEWNPQLQAKAVIGTSTAFVTVTDGNCA